MRIFGSDFKDLRRRNDSLTMFYVTVQQMVELTLRHDERMQILGKFPHKYNFPSCCLWRVIFKRSWCTESYEINLAYHMTATHFRDERLTLPVSHWIFPRTQVTKWGIDQNCSIPHKLGMTSGIQTSPETDPVELVVWCFFTWVPAVGCWFTFTRLAPINSVHTRVTR